MGLSGRISSLNGGPRFGLRLAALKVFSQRRGKTCPLPGPVIVRLLPAFVVVNHAKRLRHFRPCGKDRAIRGYVLGKSSVLGKEFITRRAALP